MGVSWAFSILMNGIIMSELDFSESRGKMSIKKKNYSTHNLFLTFEMNEKNSSFQNCDQWDAVFTSKFQWEGCFPPSHFPEISWDGKIIIIVTDIICCMLIRV